MTKDDLQSGRVVASFEQVALSNMVLLEAPIELLVEKDLVSRDEIVERVKKLKAETSQLVRNDH